MRAVRHRIRRLMPLILVGATLVGVGVGAVAVAGFVGEQSSRELEADWPRLVATFVLAAASAEAVAAVLLGAVAVLLTYRRRRMFLL